MDELKLDKIGAEKFLEFYCRHLVVLSITYREIRDGKPIEKLSFFACPGVLICIGGFCNFLTAGHILKNLANSLERGEILIESAVLADTFGPAVISEKPIPFDLVNEPRFFIEDEKEGLDFGLIVLRPYYLALLAKNGIKALFEENWMSQHKVHFDGYLMLGLPDEYMTFEQINSGSDSGIVGKVSPTLIPVKALDYTPKDTNPTTYPRFIGQLDMNLTISSIVGMSGGPILGFNYGPPMAYWVVAIQSSWLKERRIIFGCPLPVLAHLLTGWIDKLSKLGYFRVFDEEHQNEDSEKKT